MTNGDKVREMTNEELVRFFGEEGFCNRTPVCPCSSCDECLTQYLNQEVKE